MKSQVEVSVYSDYICPFCYIGWLRLDKLRNDYDLAIDWRFLEIHPDNPPQGRPLSELGYPAQHWRMLMAHLKQMAEEEGVELPERTFTTSSRLALKLAEAVREASASHFEALNRSLFEAYVLRGQNIGDPAVLRAVADACDLAPDLVDDAWSNPRYEQVLDDNRRSAARLGVTGTPSYVFGDQVYSGAIPLPMLHQAADGLMRRERP